MNGMKELLHIVNMVNKATNYVPLMSLFPMLKKQQIKDKRIVYILRCRSSQFLNKELSFYIKLTKRNTVLYNHQ